MSHRIKYIVGILLIVILSRTVICAQVFDKEWPEREGFIRVMKISDFNGTKIPLYGFLKKDRSVFIPCIYDYAGDFHCGLAVVASLSKSIREKDEVNSWLQPKYSYINNKGNNLNFSFDFATDVNEESKSILIGVPFVPYLPYPAMYEHTKYQFQEISLEKLLKCIGRQQELNIPTSYMHWGDYQEKDNAERYKQRFNLSMPLKDFHKNYFQFSTNNVTANLSNHDEIETKNDTLINNYIIVVQHGLCGIKNARINSFHIPCMFEDIKVLGKNKIGVKRGRWAIMEISGNYLTDFIFDKVEGVFNDDEIFAMASKIHDCYIYDSSWRYNFKTYSLSEENLNSVIETYFNSK